MIFIENFLAMLGLFSITLGVLYVLKLYSNKRAEDSAFVEDQKVYEAARLFAEDCPSNEVKELLSKCLDFDEEEVEEIVSKAEKNSLWKNVRYVIFIKSVNSILGTEIYNTDSNNKLTL